MTLALEDQLKNNNSLLTVSACTAEHNMKRTMSYSRDNHKDWNMLLKKSKLGRAGSVYKMKNEIVGHKKVKQEATAVRDPKTNELIVSKEKIKEVTLDYMVNNLQGNKPDEEVKEMVEMRRKIQQEKMVMKGGDTLVFQPMHNYALVSTIIAELQIKPKLKSNQTKNLEGTIIAWFLSLFLSCLSPSGQF